MPPQVSGRLGPRRRIATTLKQWREKSGRSLVEVEAKTLISTSKISRLENAEGKPRLRDVRDLIRFYGREGTPEADELERWVAEAQVPGWWTDFGDVLVDPIRLDTHVAYEADATVERVYTLPFVPALLQTDDYAEAVYRDNERRPKDQINKLIDIRHKRKEALKKREGLDPLKLVAVTHECTLRQTVGSPKIMRDQLDELLIRSHDENVELYVFPFSAKPVFTMVCMYAYFEYKDPQDLVQIETQAGFWTIDDQDRVAEYRKAHDSLRHASLDENESRELIRSIRDSTPLSLAELSSRRLSWRDNGLTARN
jgi:transcriptional regulator with XRE-family HTH domain